MRCLLDTNAVVEQLKCASIPPPTFMGEYALSVISEAELLRLPGIGKMELELVERLIGTLHVIPVYSSTARLAAKIGRTRTTKLPDLLIAATALESGLPIFTRNIKDFKDIPNLKLLEEIP